MKSGFIPEFMVRTKALHIQSEQMLFFTRYQTPQLTLMDHYRHLCQLVPIYELLEEKMKDIKFKIILPDEFKELLMRLEKLKKDIAFFEKLIPKAQHNPAILPKTKIYIDYLKTLDINNKDHQYAVFTHFLVRILGDLFGGQKIKGYVKKLFSKDHKQMNDAKNTDPNIDGVQFYYFQPSTLRNFGTWLNAQRSEIDDGQMDDMMVAANSAFEYQIKIFEELEGQRKAIVFQQKQPENSAGFFSSRNIDRASLCCCDCYRCWLCFQ